MLNFSSPPEPRSVANADSGAAGGEVRLGQTLKGKWRLDAVLGSGGTATVYAATHRNGNRMAVKVLHRCFSTMPVERERFAREGFFANKVDHPDAVKVLDEDVDEEGNLFLVMELLDGEPLVARWKAADYRLPVPEALWIADRLLAVLEVAHARGIVHRDIKPENLFLTATGGLKVLDFGIARLRGMGSGTMRGIVLGTPGFTAPEQARGEWDIVGPRTDIWAVGATLFALLTGKLVHEEEQTAAHLLRVSMEPAPPVRQIEASVPEAVARAIDCALSFSPELRFGSAEEMRQSIASAYRLTTGQSMGGRRPATAVTSAAYAPTLRVTTGTTVITRKSNATARRGINRWDAIAAATAFFALVGTVVGFWATRHPPADTGDEVASAATAAAPATRPTSIAPASETPSGARLGTQAIAAESAALMPPAPDPPPPGLAAPLATTTSPPALATAQGPARPRSDRRAASTARALTNTEGVSDQQAQVVPIPVTALPPAPQPGSAAKRPRPAGDNFDFVETRR